MSKRQIRKIIEQQCRHEGLVETGIKGVRAFRYTEPLRCTPVVIDPCVVAIVGGVKEAILEGKSHLYDEGQYFCCPMSMPVEAGTRKASPENPLLGVHISLDTRVMTELAIEIETVGGTIRRPTVSSAPKGLALARWDDAFTDAMWRLLQLITRPTDTAILGEGRLREVLYAVLNGDAGASAKRAFGVGNEVARSIEFLSSRMNQPVTIEDMAAHVGMSRAVLHRRFKQATTMSPIQFMKAMRLNSAALKIAEGMTVNQAAMDVGYVSPSQFSREFKRLYGRSPKQWSHSREPGSVLA